MDLKTRKAVEERINKIAEKKGGRITPDDVVADAKKKSSPLHPLFEWDDTKAAAKYRTIQARDILRQVHIETTVTHREVTPRYVRDPQCGKGQGYVDLVSVRSEEDISADILNAEVKRIVSLIERACSVAETLGLRSQMNDLLRRAVALQTKVAARA